MAKADYTQLATEVVKAVGGKENIISVANCMTRLRLVLKDDSIPDNAKVKSIAGVQGVMKQGGQYQIVIGTHVSDVKPFVEQVIGGPANAGDSQADADGKKDSIFNTVMKTISGCITPILGLMVGSGILKGILAVCITFGILTDSSGTYQVLYAAADTVLYFMPILVGFAAGKVYGCSPYITAVVGGALLYPSLVSALAAAQEAGETMTFLRIPIANATYSSTLLPIIVAALVASKIEKLCKKYIPKMLQLMFVPAITLGITVPMAWLVIGPVMNFISNMLSSAIMGIYNFSPILGGVIFGAFWQVFVLLGLHTALATVLFVDFFTTGTSPILAILGITVWALAGVSLGYALKKKDTEKRSLGFGNLASCLCGITEPTVYSICLEDIKCFITCFIGGGVGGGILVALGGTMYAMAGDGIFKLPAVINPAGIDISFYGFVICALLSMGISAVLTFAVVPSDEKKSAPAGSGCTETAQLENEAGKEIEIRAFVDGKVLPIEEVEDLTFAEKMLGDGIAIEPSGDTVVAPADAVINTVMDTKHAVGFTLDNGMEILIHIGIDTVDMKGDGFTAFVKEGDHVKAGEKLLTFDPGKIAAAGHAATIMLVVTDMGNAGSIEKFTGNDVKAGSVAVIIAK